MHTSGDRQRWPERRFRAMGTDVHVIVSPSDRIDSNDQLDRAQELVTRAEQRWSRFIPDSELSQINGAAGQVTMVSGETFDLIDLAISAWAATDGAFDPCLGDALAAAGYDDDFDVVADRDHGDTRPEAPSSTNRSRSTPGLIDRHRPTSTVCLPPGTVIDLGGIAKGYTADRVAGQLVAEGIAGCCVNIGGDLRVVGEGPDDGAWSVTLACPGSIESRVVRLASGGVCTSSTSKRRWLTEDGPAHHLLDPETGRSREDGPATVIAIAATATGAEITTKWMMAGGRPDRFEATGLTVLADGSVVHHDGLDQFLEPGR